MIELPKCAFIVVRQHAYRRNDGLGIGLSGFQPRLDKTVCLFHALVDVNAVVLEADSAGVDGDMLYLGADSAFRENRVVGGDSLVCFPDLPTREQRLVWPAIARMSSEQ